MDQTAAPSASPELEVLTDEELAAVVGGADVRGFDAKEYAYRTLGMCGCGLAH